MKLNREIRGLGHKVFGETITGIDANGNPIPDMESEILERVAGMQGGGIGRTGKAGERALRRAVGGLSQAPRWTDWGKRYIDQLSRGIAHEAKVGYQALSDRILKQVAKDAELIRTAQVRGATWHFYTSSVTDVGGPSQALIDALRQAGIKIIIH